MYYTETKEAVLWQTDALFPVNEEELHLWNPTIRPIFELNSQCYFYRTERVVGIDFKTTLRFKTVKYAQYILCTLYTAEPLISDLSVFVSLG